MAAYSRLLLLLGAASALRLDTPDGGPRYKLLSDGAPGEAAGAPTGEPANGSAAACVPLVNQGSHYTVEVAVGSPPLKLDLLADTGSDALIVNSCQCRQEHGCNEDERCYSPHRSATFNQSRVFKGHAQRAVLSFGSGNIETRIGSDVVKVGSVSAELTSGLFMLVKRELKIDSKFEGILGLGPPHEKVPNETQFEPYGFLEAAGIDRFSVCLNRGGRGFLRLGTSPVGQPLGSVAKAHWGLKFQGVSVGNWRVRGICGAAGRTCAAMPDSGTTLITAPAPDLKALFSHICTHWPRCNATFQDNPYKAKHMYFHFERLLLDCHEWAGLPGEELNVTAINTELPPIRFTMEGSNGERQQLRLVGEDYLTHMRSATYLHAAPKWLGGMLPQQGKMRKICAPAFHPMNATSSNLGQIWILGLPILQKYQVNYDRGSHPPSMSFTKAPCDGCDEVRLSAEGSSSQVEGERGLMWLDDAPRVSPFFADEL